MANHKSVIIIGAGIGGLCLAARLANRGYRVQLLEKNAQVGGRANQHIQDGFQFDMGPTLLMMIDTLEETFRACGKNLHDYVDLRQLEPNYQVFFGDNSEVTMSSNLPSLLTELARLDPQAPEQFFKFFARVSYFYRLARPHVIEKNFDNVWDFLQPSVGAKLIAHSGIKSLYKFVSQYFSDERLRQLFCFQSMYLGVSPAQAPAVYSMVSYMETALGVWYPIGGMYALPKALAKLGRELGVRTLLNSPVDRIVVEHDRAVGVVLGDGTELKADLVVSNADLSYSYDSLLDPSYGMPPRRRQRLQQAGSAQLFYWGVKNDLAGLNHHSVFLSPEFNTNLEDIFEHHTISKNPSFYMYIPTKTDPRLAPVGHSVVYILVPTPNMQTNIDWLKARKQLRGRVLKRLHKTLGFDIEPQIVVEHVFGPEQFAQSYNLAEGSAFGLSHTLFQSGWFRPHNVHASIKNLFFVGASTTPGGGIPMVAISAKLVEERIVSYRG